MFVQALMILHVAAAQMPYDADVVPEPVLAEQRGGVRLPNGIDVALSIDTTTAIDGRIVLQTVTRIDEGAPQTAIFVPSDGANVSLPDGNNGGGRETASRPTVTYDRQNGLQLSWGGRLPVTVSSGVSGPQQVAEGLEQIETSVPVATASGVVSREPAGVSLQAADIRILHLSSNAVGSAIANSGNDRAIDTLTTLSIDLSNAGPEVLGSAMLRVERMATDALSTRF
ncbi:hypothetical protein [Aurantiacibacter suaedae]|uniref:hypothetical protein n=1 Tax=Aurantiacibacter suaedae TaxID=2545755 RepID=UPI0010F5C764|nr:hypothetical protein [Aurantiacibacter suaedae]